MSIFINLSVLGTSLWQFIFSWWGVRVAYPLEAKEKHHLVALKIRLEAHILFLSAAAVAAEVMQQQQQRQQQQQQQQQQYYR